MKETIPSLRRMAVIADFSNEELRKLHYAFRKLLVLKKIPIPERMEGKREIFESNKEKYQAEMTFISNLIASKGYTQPVFRDMEDFEVSSDDYDYWYELKTSEQLKAEEIARVNGS